MLKLLFAFQRGFFVKFAWIAAPYMCLPFGAESSAFKQQRGENRTADDRGSKPLARDWASGDAVGLSVQCGRL